MIIKLFYFFVFSYFNLLLFFKYKIKLNTYIKHYDIVCGNYLFVNYINLIFYYIVIDFILNDFY